MTNTVTCYNAADVPTTDIFIKTCEHDVEYHRYCLASISKFCTGFRHVVEINDNGDTPANPYLFQQLVKLNADKHTDADFILVTDSDTLFSEPVTPESFMRDGKPIWYMTPFKELEGSDCHKAWFPVLAEFFGEEPEFEMMRRQPFMFPREVLKGLRNYCYAQHDITIEDYVYRKGRFSEWNILGNFCWMYHREKFSWINTSVECPPAKVRQFWSHAPVSENLEEINSILT